MTDGIPEARPAWPEVEWVSGGSRSGSVSTVKKGYISRVCPSSTWR